MLCELWGGAGVLGRSTKRGQLSISSGRDCAPDPRLAWFARHSGWASGWWRERFDPDDARHHRHHHRTDHENIGSGFWIGSLRRNACSASNWSRIGGCADLQKLGRNRSVAGKFFFKMATYTLLVVIAVAFALNVLLPGFGSLFFERVGDRMDTLLLLGLCLLAGIYMARRD